jgi:Uma2 family endonuclease
MAIKESVKTYTAEDLWELSHSPEYADKRLELVEGELIEMAPAALKHGNWASLLDRVVGNFVDEYQLGVVTAAETGYILFKNPNGKDTVRAPDVGFISKGRLPENPDEWPDGYAPFAPDLAIEVVSPNDTADEIQDRVNDYLKYGTRFVWVFYPKSKSAVVHAPNGSITLGINDELDGGDVLPGFKLPLRRIFRDDDE